MVEPGHHVAAARRGGEVEPQLPALPRLLDDVQPLERLVEPGRLAGQLLAHGDVVGLDVLVVVPRVLHRLVDALGRPLPGAPGPLGEVLHLLAVAAVRLLGVAPGRGPLVEVGLPAAAEGGAGAAVLVELEDAGDGPFEEGPVVRHHHDDAGEALEERLQPAQPVEVEVVGRLVEQQHVDPGQQDRGQGQPGRLPARQRGGRLVEHRVGEAEVLADLARPRASKSAAPTASQRSSAAS